MQHRTELAVDVSVLGLEVDLEQLVLFWDGESGWLVFSIGWLVFSIVLSQNAVLVVGTWPRTAGKLAL